MRSTSILLIHTFVSWALVHWAVWGDWQILSEHDKSTDWRDCEVVRIHSGAGCQKKLFDILALHYAPRHTYIHFTFLYSRYLDDLTVYMDLFLEVTKLRWKGSSHKSLWRKTPWDPEGPRQKKVIWSAKSIPQDTRCWRFTAIETDRLRYIFIYLRGWLCSTIPSDSPGSKI
jgi:hypothetical protein